MPVRLCREHPRASDGRFGDKAGAKGVGQKTGSKTDGSGKGRDPPAAAGKGRQVAGGHSRESSRAYEGRSLGNAAGNGVLIGAKIAKVPAPQADREI
jgi:hypothetical protein